MTDKELADLVVALGVGKGGRRFYTIDPETDGLCVDLFVRDWRVAGALMEKCDALSVTALEGDRWGVSAYSRLGPEDSSDNSLPRAIITACVEALEAK